jgi:hypothetical protein
MKLNIISDQTQQIANYINLVVENNELDLQKIVSNSCEEIIVSGSLDKLDYTSSLEALTNIIQKLRLGGKIIINGVDAKCLSRMVVSERISIEEYNEIITDVKSLHTVLNIRNKLLSFGLNIETDFINGYSYNISASRKNA